MYAGPILTSILSTITTTILLDLIIFTSPLSNALLLAFELVIVMMKYFAMAIFLYSRLHLVSPNPRLLKTVLGSIITTTLIFNIPNFLIDALSYLKRDKISLQITYEFNTVFALQEVLLSLFHIYIPLLSICKGKSRRRGYRGGQFY